MELQVREMSQHSFGAGPRPERKGNHAPGKVQHYDYKSTASALVNADSHSPIRCVFCQGDHAHESCQQYPDCDSRRNVAKGRCYACLRSGHSAQACKSTKRCRYCNSRFHNSALCAKKFPSPKAVEERPSGGKASGVAPVKGHAMNANAKVFTPAQALLNNGQDAPTHMHTAIAMVRGSHSGGPSVEGRLFLDTASSKSYITSALCGKIGAVTVGFETIHVNRFRARVPSEHTFPKVQVHVQCRDGSTRMITALVTDHICNPIHLFPVDFKKYPELKCLDFAEPPVDRPVLGDTDILVGGDHFYHFVTGIRHLNDDLVLLNSRLGVLLGGCAGVKTSGFDSSLVCTMLNLSDSVPMRNFDLERFWSLEEVGVTDKGDVPVDEEVMQNFQAGLSKSNGRYCVKFPTKDNIATLPTNFPLVLGRLRSLVKRLSKEPRILSAYSRILEEQEREGIIERVSLEDDADRVHYLPHHQVSRPDAPTTKLRVVYDASARSKQGELSLNDCLYRGPVLLSDLCGLVLRFRLNPVAIIADLEKAFLQVALNESDRDLTRFLWVADVRKPVSLQNLVVFRFCRVLFGVVSSPFLLAATVLHHLNTVASPTAKKIVEGLYVDNVVTGMSSAEEAGVFYKEAKEVFSQASMNLREWYSNDPAALHTIPACDRGRSLFPKVLGLRWDTQKDVLSCPGIPVPTNEVATKRKILQSIARVFDPLGLYAPVTVVGKCLLQVLWQKDYQWDEPLPDGVQKDWINLISSLAGIAKHVVPRFVGGGPGFIFELHCFCDASGKAYAAAVYLLARRPNGSTSVNLVFAKAKVAPLKRLTTPKFELMAVFVGCKVVRFAEEQLRIQIQRKVVWSDNTAVLCWIANRETEGVYASERKSRFVKNRLETIRDLKNVEYRYVPSLENPADIASRGCSLDVLQSYSLWWNGPQWLPDSGMWPEPPAAVKCAKLVGSDAENVCQEPSIVAPGVDPTVVWRPIFDLSRYSSLDKVFRVTALVFRFVDRCRGSRLPEFLTVCERRRAEAYWIDVVQHQRFPALFDRAVRDPTARALQQKLNVVVDSSGVLRSQRGRLENAELPESAMHPALLPRNHPLTDLIISHVHRTNCHVGVDQTLAEIRYYYWIPQGKPQVKRVLSNCTVCRRVTGTAFRPPDPPPLPPCRVTRQEPFATTGLDYIGPLLISDDANIRKVCVVLFTCAVVRSVHLEVVVDLSSKHFLMALRRFTSLYGKPDLLISDNASQLHASRRALVKLLQRKDVQDACFSQSIQWKFLPELSPWMGGFYERLVGTVKVCLKKVLGRRRLGMVELQTVVAEVASVINARPLTYVGEGVSLAPLSPSHFLSKRGRSNLAHVIGAPDQVDNDPGATAEELRTAWKRSKTVLDDFWSRWSKEYLLSLRQRSEKRSKGQQVVPTINSVVLVKAANVPRGQWRIARIAALNKSGDGMIRSAVVSMPNGKKLVRPLRLLYPIEVGDACPPPSSPISDDASCASDAESEEL